MPTGWERLQKYKAKYDPLVIFYRYKKARPLMIRRFEAAVFVSADLDQFLEDKFEEYGLLQGQQRWAYKKAQHMRSVWELATEEGKGALFDDWVWEGLPEELFNEITAQIESYVHLIFYDGFEETLENWTQVQENWDRWAGEEYSGQYAARAVGNGFDYPELERGNIVQAIIVCWLKVLNPNYGGPGLGHNSYGKLDYRPYIEADTYARFKATFWYDSEADIKWGRLEKLIDGNWIQQGEDTNFGSGAPASGSIELWGQANSIGRVYYDDVYVYEIT